MAFDQWLQEAAAASCNRRPASSSDPRMSLRSSVRTSVKVEVADRTSECASMNFSTSGMKDLIGMAIPFSYLKTLEKLYQSDFSELYSPMVDSRFANKTFNAGKLAFRKLAEGLAVVLPGSKRAIVYVLPDLTYPTMWRIRFPDGCLSAMANMSRAKDAALLHAAAILNRPGQGAEPLAAA